MKKIVCYYSAYFSAEADKFFEKVEKAFDTVQMYLNYSEGRKGILPTYLKRRYYSRSLRPIFPDLEFIKLLSADTLKTHLSFELLCR